jgi:hypothetical protein
MVSLQGRVEVVLDVGWALEAVEGEKKEGGEDLP